MDEAELAKELLLHDSANLVSAKILNKPEIISRDEQVYFNSFDLRIVFRIETDIEVTAEDFNRLSRKRVPFITNWHVEHSEMQRQSGDFFLFEDKRIYKNEICKGYVDHIDVIEKAVPGDYNPFEAVSMPTSQSTMKKIIGFKLRFGMVLDERIAREIIPNLTNIYLIPLGALDDR